MNKISILILSINFLFIFSNSESSNSKNDTLDDIVESVLRNEARRFCICNNTGGDIDCCYKFTNGETNEVIEGEKFLEDGDVFSYDVWVVGNLEIECGNRSLVIDMSKAQKEYVVHFNSNGSISHETNEFDANLKNNRIEEFVIQRRWTREKEGFITSYFYPIDDEITGTVLNAIWLAIVTVFEKDVIDFLKSKKKNAVLSNELVSVKIIDKNNLNLSLVDEDDSSKYNFVASIEISHFIALYERYEKLLERAPQVIVFYINRQKEIVIDNYEI